MATKIESRVTTSHWGAFRVLTNNNRIIGTEAFAADPHPSQISESLAAAVHHKTRVARPSFRRGWLAGGDRSRELRGRDEFVELPWDEALDIVAAELQRVIAEHGNESIFGGSYGWASAGRFHHALSQLHRFLNVNGGYVASFASYSTAAAQAIIPHVFGIPFLKFYLSVQNTWPTIARHTQTLVMFGGINPKNSQVSMGGVTHHETDGWFREFDRSGMRRINVSPQVTDSPPGSEWLAVIPGTDTALMLGIAHVLETEDLVERDFLAGYTTGYDRFSSYLLGATDGQPKSPEWAAKICGIDAETQRKLARNMAATRTLITVAWSLQRAQNGEQPYWMAATLAAMLGQIGLPGGGIGYGYGAIGAVGVAVKRMHGLTFPQGENSVKTSIPVARVADMLLNPGEPYDFNGERRHYADIRLVYWCGGNPFHHHQDLNKMLEAWQKPDTIIVHEWCWNSMAKHADIVLPCTTSLERNDIAISPRDPYVIDMQQAISPVASSRNDYAIFSGIARVMGVEQEFTEGRSEQQWIEWIYQATRERAQAEGMDMPAYVEFRKSGWFKPAAPEQPVVMLAAYRDDPLANPLSTPSGKIEIYSAVVAGFDYSDCPGHASWMEPLEWLGGDIDEFPLHLISNQPKTKLHSQLDHGSHSRAAKIKQREPIMLHPEDAKARGLANGDIVRVFNHRGACLGGVTIDDQVMQGVVQMSSGAWFDPQQPASPGSLCKHGNPNVLTPDIGTSRLAQGPIAHTCMVEIEAFSGPLPGLTAFDAPRTGLQTLDKA